MDNLIFDKPTIGSAERFNSVADYEFNHFELIGLCIDICVVSNALLLKAYLPELIMKIIIEYHFWSTGLEVVFFE